MQTTNTRNDSIYVTLIKQWGGVCEGVCAGVCLCSRICEVHRYLPGSVDRTSVRLGFSETFHSKSRDYRPSEVLAFCPFPGYLCSNLFSSGFIFEAS